MTFKNFSGLVRATENHILSIEIHNGLLEQTRERPFYHPHSLVHFPLNSRITRLFQKTNLIFLFKCQVLSIYVKSMRFSRKPEIYAQTLNQLEE